MKPFVSSIGIIFVVLFFSQNGIPEEPSRYPFLFFCGVTVFGAIVLFLAGRFVLSRFSDRWFSLALVVCVLVPLIGVLCFKPSLTGSAAGEIFGPFAGFIPGLLFYCAVGWGTYAKKGRIQGLSFLEWLGLRLFLFPQLVLTALVVISVLVEMLLQLHPVLAASSLFQNVAGIALFLGMLLILPFFLRYLFPFEELSGELGRRLEGFAQRAGIRYRKIIVWKTGKRSILNACVAGIAPCSRYVFFTDALIGSLTPVEVESVFAHELSHVRFRHFFSLMLLLAGASACFLGLYHFVEPYPLFQKPFLLIWWVFFLLIPFARISRILELQADLGAIRLGADPYGLISSLEKLETITGTRNRKHSWRHFSIPYRVDSIRRFLESESFRVEFQKRKGRAMAGILSFFLAGVVLVWATGSYKVQKAPQKTRQEMFFSAASLFRSGEQQLEQAEKKLVKLLEKLQLETIGVGWTSMFQERVHRVKELETMRMQGYKLLAEIYMSRGKGSKAKKAERKAIKLALSISSLQDKEEEREKQKKTTSSGPEADSRNGAADGRESPGGKGDGPEGSGNDE